MFNCADGKDTDEQPEKKKQTETTHNHPPYANHCKPPRSKGQTTTKTKPKDPQRDTPVRERRTKGGTRLNPSGSGALQLPTTDLTHSNLRNNTAAATLQPHQRWRRNRRQIKTTSSTVESREMETRSTRISVKEWFKSSQALLSMLLVQVFATGMQILSRVILVQGTFIFALIAYRHVVAALCVAPFALYFERGRPKKFNWRVLFWLFVNALVGMTMALGLFYYGLRDTSATYSVNFLNLVPIATFLTSIICRMENLRLKTWAGKAKCVGAILCVGGALATSLYKGKEFYIGHDHSHHSHSAVVSHKTHMLRGTFFLVGSCCSYTAWFILQVKLLNVFPLRYWGIMLACIMAAIQSAIIGAFIDSSKAAWRLEWNLQLLTIFYSGALATAATFCLLSWAITIKGPTYPPMFNPLALIFVATSEAIILGEPLRVGTLLGMVLIITGLYSFLWGKKNENPRLPQTNVAAAELSTSVTDDPAVAQSTAVVVPSSSPNDDNVVLEIEKN